MDQVLNGPPAPLTAATTRRLTQLINLGTQDDETESVLKSRS
jgi:hypothetical protein